MKLIGQLWYILNPRERTEGAILLCALALGAMFEALSIGLVVPFIAVLMKDSRLILDAPVIQPMLIALDIRDPQKLLIAMGLGLVGAFVVKSGFLFLLYRWLFHYAFEKHISLARQLLSGYLYAPYTFHLQRNTADLIKITTETIQRFTTGFLVSLLVILGEVLVVAALGTLLMIIDPLATCGGLLVLGIASAVIYLSMKRRLAEGGRVAEKSMTSMIQWTEQAIGGLKETLVMDRAQFFIGRHGDHARQFAEAWGSFVLLSHIPRLVIDTLAVTAMVSVAMIALARGQDLGSILPVLGMFAVAAIRLMPSANRIANGLIQLRFHYAATDILYNELRATEPGGVPLAKPASDRISKVPLRFERSLVLEHLSYKYPSMPRLAVDDVSLEIFKGSWVAFIGPTGAGKTSLVDLILGLLVPTSGRILIDGHSLHDDVVSWQRNIGYVPQDIYLMDDTIRRNVAFGLQDLEIDDERVWRALSGAQVDRLVRSLPDGLAAVIGERGARLSGGERQRLGIARALYRDPAILVVDEGTANLDNETEAAIVNTLAGLRGEKTIIVVAHRLALVRSCDHVYLLREGRLRNSGSYAEMLSTDPAFRQFVESAA